MNILIIDEDDSNYSILRKTLLNVLGPETRVRRAENCDAAWEMIGEESYDVCAYNHPASPRSAAELMRSLVRRGCKAPVLCSVGRDPRESFEEAASHMEKALERSEETARRRSEEMERLMELAPIAICVAHDPQCSRIIGNEAANRLYEAEAGENISAAPVASGAPSRSRRFFRGGRELLPRELPMQRAAAEGATLRDCELDVLLPSGKVTSLLGDAAPLRDAAGSVRGAIAAFVDITEHKRALETLRASEIRHRSLLEAMNDAVIEYDVGLSVTYANGRALRILGLEERSEIVGKSLARLVEKYGVGESARGLLARIDFVGRQGHDDGYASAFELEFIATNRRRGWLLISSKLIRAADGSLCGGVAVGTDITDFRKAQEEARIREQQLVRLDRLTALGVLAAGVAHEINNPNNLISFNIATLRDYIDGLFKALDGCGPEEEQSALRGMPRSTFREELVGLIDDMEHGCRRIDTIVSQLSRHSHSNYSCFQAVDPRQAIERAILFCRDRIKERATAIEVEISPRVAPIRTNPDAMEQVLINLILNAAQAMDKPERRIDLKVSPLAGGGASIEVRDNGCGMEEAVLGKIFDPFFTTKPPGEGAGLGLHLCNNLLSVIGGSIEVESEPGVGSIFRVHVPDVPRAMEA